MAKTSERYWEDRTQEEEAAISKKTNQYLSKIKLMYQAGKRELEREVQAFYKQYATENGMNPTELKKKLKPEEWKAYQSKIESLLEKTAGRQPEGAQSVSIQPSQPSAGVTESSYLTVRTDRQEPESGYPEPSAGCVSGQLLSQHV